MNEWRNTPNIYDFWLSYQQMHDDDRNFDGCKSEDTCL